MLPVPMSSPQPCDPALKLFLRTMQSGWFFRILAQITHRAIRLLDLDETLCCAQVSNSSYAGLRPVPIDLIQGTQGKRSEFDAGFHPQTGKSRTRWLEIARERLRGHQLPPVDLVEVNGIYFVRDGHHRISVARSLGESFIDAEIIRMSILQRMH